MKILPEQTIGTLGNSLKGSVNFTDDQNSITETNPDTIPKLKIFDRKVYLIIPVRKKFRA